MASGIATEVMYDKVAYSAPKGSEGDKSILGHEYNIKYSETKSSSGVTLSTSVSKNVTWGQVFTEGVTGVLAKSLPALFTPTVNTLHAIDYKPIKGSVGIDIAKYKSLTIKASYGKDKKSEVFNHRWFHFLYY